MSNNPDLKSITYSADFLRSVSDEANKWRAELAEIMVKCREHAQQGHYSFEWHTSLNEQLMKQLHLLGFKVHSNKRMITWQ